MDSRAVIFDLDGVIVDSEPLYFEVYQRIYAAFGATLTHAEFAEIAGMSAAGIWHHLHRRYAVEGTATDFAAMEARLKYKVLRRSVLKPIRGIPQLIRALRAREILIALASGSHTRNIDLILRKLRLADYFAVVVGGDSVTHGKPDPEIFLRAANMAGRRSDQCLVVEDSANGVIAAKAVGMRCVLYSGGSRGGPAEILADAVIDRFSVADFDRFLQWLE